MTVASVQFIAIVVVFILDSQTLELISGQDVLASQCPLGNSNCKNSKNAIFQECQL